MARASVTTERISRAGLPLSPTAPRADGDVIDAGTVLYVVNAGAAPVTVTVAATTSVDGLAVEDLTSDVPAGATSLIGPFSVATFGQDVDGPDHGRVYVNYSDVASVTRSVVGF